MPDDRAAFTATYIALKPMKTQPCVRIELEVPIERAQQVIDALGWPRPGEAVHVAVARLAEQEQS